MASKILLVEDDRALREALADTLALVGMTTERWIVPNRRCWRLPKSRLAWWSVM